MARRAKSKIMVTVTPPKQVSLIFFEATRSRRWKTGEWWALGWDTNLPTMDVERWYEIHPRDIWWSGMVAPLDEPKRYARWLDALPGEKVLWKKEKDVRRSVAYPIDKITRMPGVGTYLASSMAFMLCQAVLDGYRRIGIFGCDFNPGAWQEIAFERPNLAYLIGLFRGQGIDVVVPEGGTLWELELLDDAVGQIWHRPYGDVPGKLFHREYARGFMIGSGRAEKVRNDPVDIFENPPLPWKKKPFYGHETLEEVGATPKKYSALLRGEKGIVL